MKLSARDRWLLTALPAVLTVLFYLAVLMRPVMREIGNLRLDLKRQDPVAVRAARLQQSQSENRRLTLELNNLRQTSAEGDKIAASPAFVAPQRAKTLREVSRLCEQTGMTLICSTPGGEAKPSGQGTSVQTLLNKTGWKDAEVWRLELRGGYREMLRLLEMLASDRMAVIPMGVNMEPAADDSKPISWVLTVWI